MNLPTIPTECKIAQLIGSQSRVRTIDQISSRGCRLCPFPDIGQFFLLVSPCDPDHRKGWSHYIRPGYLHGVTYRSRAVCSLFNKFYGQRINFCLKCLKHLKLNFICSCILRLGSKPQKFSLHISVYFTRSTCKSERIDLILRFPRSAKVASLLSDLALTV